jgi:HSP20 family protein
MAGAKVGPAEPTAPSERAKALEPGGPRPSQGELRMMTTHLLVPRRSTGPVASLGWSDFDHLFDQLWKGVGFPTRPAGADGYAPRIDFTETDTEMRVAAELPGLEEKDIDVSLEEGVLTIRGERKALKNEGEAKAVRHVETFHGKYQRSLRLPSEVDPDGVKAVYRNGILTVTLPKPREAQPQTRVIPVTSGA